MNAPADLFATLEPEVAPAPPPPPPAPAPVVQEAAPVAVEQVCGTCGNGSSALCGTGYDAGYINCRHLPAARWQAKTSPCTLRQPSWVLRQVVPADIRRAAQEGIDRAVSHAEREIPGWKDAAYEFISGFVAARIGKQFTGYEIVKASKESGIQQPPNSKAWGGPIQRAARAQIIFKVGTVPDPNPERHGSDVPLWEARGG